MDANPGKGSVFLVDTGKRERKRPVQDSIYATDKMISEHLDLHPKRKKARGEGKDDEEENARALTSARKGLAAKVRESAVRAKAKIRILRSELKAAREAAETEREASAAERAAAASAREEMATYREKWMDEKRAAAVAEAVAEKAKEHVALAREERAEAREERDAARRETLEKTRELHALRESTEPARRESQAAIEEAQRAAARSQQATATAEAELAADPGGPSLESRRPSGPAVLIDRLTARPESSMLWAKEPLRPRESRLRLTLGARPSETGSSDGPALPRPPPLPHASTRALGGRPPQPTRAASC